MSAKAEEKGGKKGKPVLMIVGAVVLVAVLILGKGFLGGAKAEGKEKKKKKAKTEIGINLPLEEFIVNLEGSGEHYLRTTIALGLKKGLTEEKAKEEVAPMRDAILNVLSTKSIKELSSAKERDELKKEIKEKVNEALSHSSHSEDEDEEEDTVIKVYFTAFATQ